MHFLAALTFFTRLPLPQCLGKRLHSPASLAQTASYLPAVGWLVGGIGALVLLSAALGVPVRVAIVLSMMATIWATGAFHEDGLADCCDAFGGAYTTEDVLRILRDSRIGAFGAVGLILALLLKFELLCALQQVMSIGKLALLLIAAHAASRLFAVSYLWNYRYVRQEGKAQPVVTRMTATGIGLASLFGLPVLFYLEWRLAGLMLVLLVVARHLLGRYFVRRLGGYTGDCLGLAQQLSELLIYLLVCIRLTWGTTPPWLSISS